MSRNAKTFAAGLAGGLAKGYLMRRLWEKEQAGKAKPAAAAEATPVAQPSVETTDLPPLSDAPADAPAAAAPPMPAAGEFSGGEYEQAWANDMPLPDQAAVPFISAQG